MLNIAQLAQVKARDPYVYESLRQIVTAINAIGRATGVDPSGSILQPDRIGGISALAANGIFDIAITDNSAVHRGIYYFAESDVSPNFTAPLKRCVSAPVAPSAPVTFGSPPTAVAGGGSAGPTLQPSSGSGTATGQQGGSGFGTALTLETNATTV